MLELLEHQDGRGYDFGDGRGYGCGDGYGNGDGNVYSGCGNGWGYGVGYHTFPSTWHITANLLPNLMVEVRC